MFEFLSVSGYVDVILTPFSNKGLTTHIRVLPFADFQEHNHVNDEGVFCVCVCVCGGGLVYMVLEEDVHISLDSASLNDTYCNLT